MGADELQRADDTFSYKSYLLLARNLAEYWPRRDRHAGVGERSRRRRSAPWSDARDDHEAGATGLPRRV